MSISILIMSISSVLVFHPFVVYQTRVKRDLWNRDNNINVKVPVQVKFKALGREFNFELEPASQPFTKMSHVLIRR